MDKPKLKKRPPTIAIPDSNLYETLNNMSKNSRSLQDYVNDVLQDHIEKEAFLRRFAPHLSIYKVEDNHIKIIDEHINKIITVELNDNRFWCSEDKPKACMHVFYAMGCRKVGTLIDKEIVNHN